MFDLEVDKVIEEVKSRNVHRVLLQLPDGLRPQAFELIEEIKGKIDVEVILSGDSCYGACDLASKQAMDLGVDLLIHYGHTCFVESEGVPVLYLDAKIPIDTNRLVEAIIPHLGDWKKIGLATTTQHAAQLRDIQAALLAKAVNATISEGSGRTPLNGQVLGCDFNSVAQISEDVEGYIYIGGGRFHPLGLALTSGREVIIANPYNATVSRIGGSEIMQLAKLRMAAIASARKAKRIGVLVSSKPGQKKMDFARDITRKLNMRGIITALIYLDEVRADGLNNFSEADAFIVTACPRIAIDGVAGINRPMLTSIEAGVLLEEKRWEDVWGRFYLG